MINFEQLPRFKKFQFEILNRIPEWALVYDVPPEAIERQLGFAHGWIGANARKAPKNVIRFLWNWMRKAQEFDNLKARPSMPKVLVSSEAEPDMTFEEMQEIRRKNFGELKHA